MITVPTLPTLTTPSMIDLSVSRLNVKLLVGLSWLDHAFGKVKRIVEHKDGKLNYFPALYISDDEYFSVFPSDQIGNYSFWSIHQDGHEIETFTRMPEKLTTKISLIFWFRYDGVYPATHETMTIENVKGDILTVLRDSGTKEFKPTKIWELSENILKGYSHHEVENQFLMRPYGGLRIEGELTYNAICP